MENNNRTAKISRKTYETDIKAKINLDGSGVSNIRTGIGFFDHMLNHIAKQGFIDIELSAEGDLDVDCHHTIEDIGIVLGCCIKQAIGDKIGIKRYGSCVLPMEESLVICSLDFSGRPLLCFDCDFTASSIGAMDTEMIEEFFRALCVNSGLNLHIKKLSGKNNHHVAEAIFKAFGKALDEAKTIDPRITGVHSTKGMLQ